MGLQNGRIWVVTLILVVALAGSRVVWGQGAAPAKPAAAPAAPAQAKPAPPKPSAAPAAAEAKPAAAPAGKAAAPAQAAPSKAAAAPAANAPAPTQAKAAPSKPAAAPGKAEAKPGPASPAANAPAPAQAEAKPSRYLHPEDIKLPMNPILLGGLILCCVVWIVGVSWLNRDALENMIHRSNWTIALYVVGIVGLTAIHFVDGRLVWVWFGAQVIVLVAYICKRNTEVHPSKHVWTLSHIDRKLGYVLSHLHLIRATKASEVSKTLAHIALMRHDGQPAEPEVGKPHSYDLRALMTLKELISRGLAERATSFQLDPRPKEVVLRLRIDGVFHAFPSLKADIGARVISCVKQVAGMDAGRRGEPHEGRFSARVYAKSVDLHVFTQPSAQGEVVAVRILNKDTDLMRLDATGMRPDQVQRVRAFIRSPGGLCLVCGPPGSGKRTTLLAMLTEIDPRLRPVTTIESSVEYRLPSVNHTVLNPKTGATFASALRACVKQGPKVIMVGEIRDADTARTAMGAATSGHVMLSTVQAGDTLGALARIAELKVDPVLVAPSLRMIIAQRLVRMLCTHCRLPAHLRPEQLKKMGIVPGPNATLFRAKGCSQCHGTGHFGRTGLFEILEIGPKIAEMIRAKAAPEAIRQEARRHGFVSLLEDGYRKVANGVTSIEEIVRVCGEKERRPGG